MLRFGPDGGPVVVAALPLWEEANRSRALVAGMLRGLAARGIGGILPDLPGTGDSPIATRTASLFMMKDAYEALVATLGDRPVYGLGIRSGALLDPFGLLAGRWYLSPQTGNELLGEVLRMLAATGRRTDRWGLFGSEAPVGIAGNLVSPTLLTGLADAEPLDQAGVPRRTVRLTGDPRTADAHVEGTPPWRRAEPGGDPALARRLADDLADWIARCEG